MLSCTGVIPLIYITTEPSVPVDMQSFCDVVVWKTPIQQNGELIGYETEFTNPGARQTVTKQVSIDGNYYIIQDEDKFNDPQTTVVRVKL